MEVGNYDAFVYISCVFFRISEASTATVDISTSDNWPRDLECETLGSRQLREVAFNCNDLRIKVERCLITTTTTTSTTATTSTTKYYCCYYSTITGRERERVNE